MYTHLLATKTLLASLLLLHAPEEGDRVDPLGLRMGGDLGPEGRAHGLQQGRAVVQGAGRPPIPEVLPQPSSQGRRKLRL